METNSEDAIHKLRMKLNEAAINQYDTSSAVNDDDIVGDPAEMFRHNDDVLKSDSKKSIGKKDQQSVAASKTSIKSNTTSKTNLSNSSTSSITNTTKNATYRVTDKKEKEKEPVVAVQPELNSKSLSSLSNSDLNRSEETKTPSLKVSLSHLRTGSSVDRYKNNILNYYFNDHMNLIDEDQSLGSIRTNGPSQTSSSGHVTHHSDDPLSKYRTNNEMMSNKPASSSYQSKMLINENFLDQDDPLMDDDFLNELRAGINPNNTNNPANFGREQKSRRFNTESLYNSNIDLPSNDDDFLLLGKTSKLGSQLSLKPSGSYNKQPMSLSTNSLRENSINLHNKNGDLKTPVLSNNLINNQSGDPYDSLSARRRLLAELSSDNVRQRPSLYNPTEVRMTPTLPSSKSIFDEPMNQTEMDDMIDVMARRRLALKRLEGEINKEHTRATNMYRMPINDPVRIANAAQPYQPSLLQQATQSRASMLQQQAPYSILMAPPQQPAPSSVLGATNSYGRPVYVVQTLPNPSLVNSAAYPAPNQVLNQGYPENTNNYNPPEPYYPDREIYSTFLVNSLKSNFNARRIVAGQEPIPDQNFPVYLQMPQPPPQQTPAPQMNRLIGLPRPITPIDQSKLGMNNHVVNNTNHKNGGLMHQVVKPLPDYPSRPPPSSTTSNAQRNAFNQQKPLTNQRQQIPTNQRQANSRANNEIGYRPSQIAHKGASNYY